MTQLDLTLVEKYRLNSLPYYLISHYKNKLIRFLKTNQLHYTKVFKIIKKSFY